MSSFFRYPHTPHLAWLGEGRPRDDKLLAPGAAGALLSGPVVVEEKIDGANLGFSTTRDGELRAQNRGEYLEPGRCHPQFNPLWSWLAIRRDDLVHGLFPDRVLFGEWCYARHSVPYDRLPDWFVGFDVYDRAQHRFWATHRRDALLNEMGLQPVPKIAVGRYDAKSLVRLLGTSRVGRCPMEGLVVRSEANGWVTGRAKLVRAKFTQGIGDHWSRGELVRNHVLDESVSSSASY